MKLISLEARRFGCIKHAALELDQLNVLIGPNASGKSTFLDALHLLRQAVADKDFTNALRARGGILHLPYKGEEAADVELRIKILYGNRKFEWRVLLVHAEHADFFVQEDAWELHENQPRSQVLKADNGSGWWWSARGSGEEVRLALRPNECALAAAAADAAFPARGLVSFIRCWGFFDPSPWVLRRSGRGSELGADGQNLAAVLRNLRDRNPDCFGRIIAATQSILGVPTDLDFKEDAEGRVFYLQRESGLQFAVHQVGTSSGTLRMLALMTALEAAGEPAKLIGIEEPESYVHPAALESFARYVVEASSSTQVILTTHSPLLLDYLDEPAAICVVRRSADKGAIATREANPEGVRKALEESGFGLGEYHETTGFGA